MDFINCHERYHNKAEPALDGHLFYVGMELDQHGRLMRLIVQNGMGAAALAPSWSGF